MPTKKPLSGEISLQDLLDRLSFTQETVPQAAMEQAQLFMAASSYRIKRMASRQEAEAKYEDLRVRRSVLLRAKYSGDAKKGMTEKYINDLIDQNPEIKEARDELAKAKRLEEYAKLLLDAYDHRRSSIKVLAQFAYVEDSMRLSRLTEQEARETRERLKRGLPHKLDEDEET